MNIYPEVKEAVAEGRPVVALETALVTHGLPHPHNLEVAQRCQEVIRAGGAVPACIGVIDGQIRVGLQPEELGELVKRATVKLSARDLGWACSTGQSGGTTVAATCRIAALARIAFFSTGGIGGIHRPQLGKPHDESADLFELARQQVAVFSAGIKMILDLPATVERLESLSIPVLGYRCSELPAFYLASSGITIPSIDNPLKLAEILASSWQLGTSGILVGVAPPLELPEAAQLAETALLESQSAVGGAVTPAALNWIFELAGERAIKVNTALLIRSAEVAAEVATAFSSQTKNRKNGNNSNHHNNHPEE